MTIEEVIDLLKKDKSQRGKCFVSDALEIVINMLEQEHNILDKIREEIEILPIAFTSSMEMKKDCLKIIDKYKKENEVKE